MSRFSRRQKGAAALFVATAAAAALVAVALCPATARADDREVMAYSVDDEGYRTNYYTTDDALQAGYDGKVIHLDVDWNFTGTMQVADSQSITIDMNGHKITSGGNGPVVRMCEHSNLTLESSSSVEYTTPAYSGSDGQNIYATFTSGGLVTGGNSGDYGGGVRMDAGTTLTLDNVAVVGNYSRNGGGGVRTEKNCTVNMKNSARVAYNKGYAGGLHFAGAEVTLNMDASSVDSNYGESNGGGIYSDKDATRIFMTNGSAISNNSAQRGGGIYLWESYFHIESSDGTGSIKNNRATKCDDDISGGGGIYVSADRSGSNEGTIKGLSITGNYADLDGGGLYLYQDWTRVIGCTITNNTAREDGGGIAVFGSNNSVESCTVASNACNKKGENYEGGGIFVSCRYNIKLSGVCTIRDNYRYENPSPDDVFLSSNPGSTICAYITGGVDAGSSVGVRTKSSGDQMVGRDISNYEDGAYFMDLGNFHVTHGTDHNGDIWQRVGTA